MIKTHELDRRENRWIAVVGIFLVAFVIFVRIRLLSLPFERDEGEYAYFAQLMLKGIPPYLHAYSMKFPGIFGLYAVIMMLLGQSVQAIHIGLLVVDLFSAFFLFLIVKHLFDLPTGILSSALYAFMAVGPSVLGSAAHATHFAVFFVLAGLVIATGASSTNALSVLISGAASGAAILMKQHAVVFIPFILWYLIIQARSRSFSRKRCVNLCVIFMTGVAIPLIATGYIMYAEGVFDKFYFWTVSYARQYVSETSFVDGIGNLVTETIATAKPYYMLWLLGGCGVLVSFRKWRETRHRFAICLLLVSFLGICPGFNFRGHYYIFLLPSLAIGTAITVMSFASRSLGNRTYLFLSVLLLLTPILVTVHDNRNYFIFWTPVEVSRNLYGLNPFPESISIAKYIKQHSTAAQKVAIMGSEPQIFFYADRVSASGHIYMYGLFENQPFSTHMQNEFVSDVERERPEFIVIVRVQTSWYGFPMSNISSENYLLDWQRTGYIRNIYENVGIICLRTGRECWHEDVKDCKAQFSDYILIYKKKNNIEKLLRQHAQNWYSPEIPPEEKQEKRKRG